MKLRVLFVLGLITFFTSLSHGQQAEKRDYFAEGLAFKESDAWLKALEIWEEGKTALEAKQETDSRIGIAYIELATSNKLSYYYEKASEIYFWGLKGKNLKRFFPVIRDEARRVIPLLSSEEANDWKQLLKKRDIAIAENIRKFWTKNDPAPATAENERLIEHWERIDFARKNYTENDRTIYNTDDRGSIYIKYGDPDFKRSGQFGGRRTELLSRVFQSFEVLDIMPRLSADQANIVSLPGSSGQTRTTIMYENPRETAKWIESFDVYPEFELWRYGLENDKEPVHFLFGRKSGNGFYGLRLGVDEFVPARAYSKKVAILSKTSNRSDYIYPGPFLQVIYYEQMISMGEEYARRFNELESTWNTMNINKRLPLTVLRSAREKFISRDKNDPSKKYAPQEKSMFDDLTSTIKIYNRQIRLLDDNNTPKMIVTAFSQFSEFEKVNFEKNDIVNQKNINDIVEDNKLNANTVVRHTLSVFDSEWNSVNKITSEPDGSLGNTSVFVLNHGDPNFNYTLSADTYEKGVEPELRESLRERLESEQNILLGKVDLQQMMPLTSDFDVLEVSDPITGLTLTDNFEGSNYPFPVIPAEQVSAADPMHVYLEIYHLLIGNDNKAKFTIDYTITKPEKRSLLSRLIPGDRGYRNVAQKLLYESETARAVVNLSFDITDFNPGDYEFEFEVTDLVSGNTKTRTGSFKVVK